MFYLVGWFAITLVIAAAVLFVTAAITSDRPGAGRGLPGFLADVRSGWSALRTRRRRSTDAGADPVGDHAAAFGSVEELLAAPTAPGSAYLGPDEITEGLERARDEFTDGVEWARTTARRELRHDDGTVVVPDAPARVSAVRRRAGHTPTR